MITINFSKEMVDHLYGYYRNPSVSLVRLLFKHIFPACECDTTDNVTRISAEVDEMVAFLNKHFFTGGCFWIKSANTVRAYDSIATVPKENIAILVSQSSTNINFSGLIIGFKDRADAMKFKLTL